MLSNEYISLSEDKKEILSRYSNKLPVKLSGIARDLNLEIKIAHLNTGISGQIMNQNEKCIIRISRYSPLVYQRFTIAHQMAHFLLHKIMIDSSSHGIVDNVLYRSQIPEKMEYEANRLAFDIITPYSMICKIIQDDFKRIIPNNVIEILKKRFQVPDGAMKSRLNTVFMDIIHNEP